MNAERGPALEQRPLMLVAHSLLVHRVPGLVHRTKQERERLPFHPARRDAHVICTDAGREEYRLYWESAVDVPGPAVDFLSRVARENALYLVIGIIESFVRGSQFSSYSDAIAFMILIVILLFRPSGLFGKYEPEKV